MRYSLRTLLIVLALGPPLLAGGWFGSAYLHLRPGKPKVNLSKRTAASAQFFWTDKNGKQHTITPDGRDEVLDP